MTDVIVLGYFSEQDQAQAASHELAKGGFRRTGQLHKNRDGGVRVRDPFRRRRALAVSLSALAASALAGLLGAALRSTASFEWGLLPTAALFLAGGALGAMIAALFMRRSRYGIERRLLRQHARWLAPDETVLLLQTAPDRLASAVAILRQGLEGSPTVFFLHPKRSRVPAVEPSAASLALPQLDDHARILAESHQVVTAARPSPEILQRVDAARTWVHHVAQDLSLSSRLEQTTSPTAEWILDNEYVVESNARDVLRNLPRRYFRQLPALNGAGLPRIYSLAADLVAHSDLRLDAEPIETYLDAYQTTHPLTIGELWAYPQMLRIALIESIAELAARALSDLRERELADFWANRLMTINRRDPNQLFAIMAELTRAHPSPSPYFAAQLVGHLYDEEEALAPVQAWLERTYRRPLGELSLREQARQTQDQVAISNAFASLRQLTLLDWRQVFERQSHVERLLRTDPAGVYPDMDFETRDLYRQAIERLARGCPKSEVEIARLAVERAAHAASDDTPEAVRSHVGDLLIGDRRHAFAQALGSRTDASRRLLGAVRRHPALVYFSTAGLLAFVGLLLIIPVVPLALVLVLAAFPIGQLAFKITDYLVTRLLPPSTLPKMGFEARGIPETCRTLVVVPEMLVTADQIRANIEKLEVRFLANRDANLYFGLFMDYTDSEQPHEADDAGLLQTAVEGMETLKRRYPWAQFFLFNRQRQWSESEQKYIGWERKRGKLEELNSLIEGSRSPEAPEILVFGEGDRLADVQFVITLDSDTQLPSGTARRMVETIAHPLNRPRFDSHRRLLSGFSIIQPRVSASLPSAIATLFSRVLTDAVGIDPYTKAVSDVGQDLFGSGSYHGKGIYDPRIFSRVLSGRFPEESLLSHDLIEGAHVGVGLASDVELLDEFPPDYLTYTNREHRWIRGDWQVAAWALPSVPRPGGGRTANRISGYNRWKIFDNLRRSLVAPACVGLLVLSWLLSPQAALAAGLLLALLYLFQPLTQPLAWLTTRKGWRQVSLAKIGHDLLRSSVEAALLLHQAGLALDAILRVAYRRLISHRHLLQWTSAQAMSWSAPGRLHAFLLSMGMASLVSGALTFAVARLQPDSLPLAAPWLGLWFLSPTLGWVLNRQPKAREVQAELSAADRLFLRSIARRTWRYFSHFVNDTSHWLPPDNYQVSHREHVAMRTSPTNIGMWMLGNLAAHDFGYITPDQVVSNLQRTMQTIDQLERYEGHLLNWYDLESLSPLEPRYVSAVDSGNLLGALWCLRQGLEEMLNRPLLDDAALQGMLDTLRLIQPQESSGPGAPTAQSWARQLLAASDVEPGSVPVLQALRAAAAELASTAASPSATLPEGAGEHEWDQELRRQLAAWVELCDRYFGWLDALEALSAQERAVLIEAGLESLSEVRRLTPSLRDIASGELPVILELRQLRREPKAGVEPLLPWVDRTLEDFDRSKWLAGEMLAGAERLIEDVGLLAYGINMRFLYDASRRLFAIGYNVSAGSLDRAFYDLLASEARLGSFVAIAGGTVPLEHWFAMNRPYNAVGHRRVLLSWTGTMFEYLMPLLLQRTYRNSLLDQAARDAVEVQISYGQRRRVPWGVSECAYGDLDSQRTYQYKAFGVPALGLKRDLAQELVIAPYASLLAVGLAPRRTVANLRRMADIGLLADFGYYEAMDYTRRPRRRGELGVLVRAFMAHHQGMGLLALANLLHGDAFPRRFHAEPRVRAIESLLFERVPTSPPIHHVSTRERVPTVEAAAAAEPSISKFDTPNSPTPKTQMLSNGRYSLMVTNAGGGYSRWGEFELTRWRSDRTRDNWGTFCYVRDADTGKVWANSYHPVGGSVEGYQADFALDRATFRRLDEGIHTETEIVVSPEDDVEIRRLTLINRSARTRRLELTSYLELALAPHNVDRQHPAFNKLFIQTEAVPERRSLLAYRRPRYELEPPVFLAHRLTGEKHAEDGFEFETDRRPFIGRGRSLANPMALERELAHTQGYVLDPVLSLRRTLVLGPLERAQVSLVVAAGESRQQVLSLMDKYADPMAIERALDVAWATAQLELRLLRILPDDARRYQKLAGHMLYPGPAFRPGAERVEERNRKGQSGLWAYGISGDLPIVLVTIGEARDIQLVRQVLQAHTYWRTHGLTADLVILNEESSSYEQPLRQRLEAMIQLHTMYTGVDKPGGVFLRSADQMPEEDVRLLMAAANAILVAARGTLSQQLSVAIEAPEMPSRLVTKRAPRLPSAPLPFMDLPYFNSLGGFTQDGREYAVYLGPNTHTPAPWVNVIANSAFGTVVSEMGAGFTWWGNSQRNRLTPWSNDPVLDTVSEAIYLRDDETGVYWTPTAAPIRQPMAYRARHGAGYSVFEHNSHGIEQQLTVLVPVDDQGGAPLKLQRLRLKNDSNKTRRLSLTSYAEWVLGETREVTEIHIVSQWDEELQALMARNRFHPEHGDRVAFAALSRPADSYSADRTAFLGRNRSARLPAAMERSALSNRVGAGLDPCAALRTTLEMAPGETTEVVIMLGQAASAEEAARWVTAFRDPASFEAALETTSSWWDRILGAVEVHTPELSVDFLINRWLLYQSLSCRLWARSALYQSGGAYGFRDQLQDVLALLHAEPALARSHILLAASRQFRQGDVQHWWHPPSGSGIRSRISDDLLWLPYAVAEYVRHSGDLGILREQIPFLEAPTLNQDQYDQYLTPEVSPEQASLFEHCQRALDLGMTSGPSGLPLIGTGDWNDGMDRVGAGGKGESVWLAWFLVSVLEGMAELAEAIGDMDLGERYRNDRAELIQRIESAAWDGAWYLRATFDDGTPIGSAASADARIDLLPQAWAAISGGGDAGRTALALESARELLVRQGDSLVLLFDPPFDKQAPSPGYIQGYPPGVRENGGQYTHAAVWLAIALARQRQGARAEEVLRMLNPVERARDVGTVWRYTVEPYVISADVYNAPGRVGQGGWSWYTGSAAWMYRAWVEEVLGLKLRGETLKLDPVIPGWWSGFRATLRHGEAVYEIEVENPDGVEHGVLSLTLDGRPVPDGGIPLERDLVKHRVAVRMGAS